MRYDSSQPIDKVNAKKLRKKCLILVYLFYDLSTLYLTMELIIIPNHPMPEREYAVINFKTQS